MTLFYHSISWYVLAVKNHQSKVVEKNIGKMALCLLNIYHTNIANNTIIRIILKETPLSNRGGRDSMVVGFITTYAVSATYVVSSNHVQAMCTRYNIML